MTSSSRVCSAHFAPGCTIPYVRSVSLIKPTRPSRRPIIRHIKRTIPTLKEFAYKCINNEITKVGELELKYEEVKTELDDSMQNQTCLQTELHQLQGQVLQQSSVDQQLSNELSSCYEQHTRIVQQVDKLTKCMSSLSIEKSPFKSKFCSMKRASTSLEQKIFRRMTKIFNFILAFGVGICLRLSSSHWKCII